MRWRIFVSRAATQQTHRLRVKTHINPAAGPASCGPHGCFSTADTVTRVTQHHMRHGACILDAGRPRPADHRGRRVQQRPSPLINLYDSVKRSWDGARKYARSSYIILHIIGTTYFPVSIHTCHQDHAASVLTVKSSFSKKRLEPSIDSGCLSKVCLTNHACCFHTAERGGAHLPCRLHPSGSPERHLLFYEPIRSIPNCEKRSCETLSFCHHASRRTKINLASLSLSFISMVATTVGLQPTWKQATNLEKIQYQTCTSCHMVWVLYWPCCRGKLLPSFTVKKG